jgi:FkbM family methyltransferase
MFKNGFKKKIELIKGHPFYTKLLNDNSIIIDFGAHKGDFSFQISKTLECKCYAVEPSPELFIKINENNFVTKYNNAITSYNGAITFFISRNSQANSLNKLHASRSGLFEEVKIEAVDFETFLQRIGVSVIDLLKIDIEGAEFELFNSTSDEILINISQITIEFHDFMKGIYNTDDVEKIINRMHSLGFFCIKFSVSFIKSDNSQILFINRNSNISNTEWVYLYFVKYFQVYINYIKGIIKKYIQAGITINL